MKRLEAVCSLIPHRRLFADIGCDHGLLTHYVLCNRLADEAIATDISDECLLKARRRLSGFDNVSFARGDGLAALGGRRPDVMAICGLGGRTIAGILSPTPTAVLILQPQSDAPLLRKFLIEAGYCFEADFVAFEAGRFYDVMRLTKKRGGALSETELCFGAFSRQKDELKRRRLERLIDKLQGFKQTEANIHLLNLALEALQWQK